MSVGRWRNSPFCWRLALPCAAIPPHFFGLAQRNGVEPQRKTLLGWWRPREVSGPTRLSHSRGRCHSAAKVSASRTYFITRPKGEGLGLDADWRLKVFCPAFLQKSGRGPGAEPMAARRSARNTPMLKEAQEGVRKGEPSPGVPPFAGGSAARSPCPHRQMTLLYGNPPRSFEQGQRDGADLQRKVKPISDKTASACGFNRLSHLRTGRDRRATG